MATARIQKRKATKETGEWFNSELKTIVPEKKRRRAEIDSDDELEKNTGFVPIRNKRKNKIAHAAAPVEEEEVGVVYIGHLPFGFEEYQIQDFFKQFGEVKRSFVARSSKTGKPQGHAFVEFDHPEVAQIVADTMNDYLIFKKKLVCRVVPAVAARQIKWPPAGLTPEKSLFDLQRKAANYYNSQNKEKPVEKLIEREERKRDKLKKLGINYEFDGYTALVNKLNQTTPTEPAPAPAPQKTAEEKEKRKRQEEEVWAQRKQTKAVADETPQQKKQKLDKEKFAKKIQEKELAKKQKKAEKANGEKKVEKANGEPSTKKAKKATSAEEQKETETKVVQANKPEKVSTDKPTKATKADAPAPVAAATKTTTTTTDKPAKKSATDKSEKLSADKPQPKKSAVVKKKSK